ncbi:hypothetical protein IQ25_01359 [Novosphingobium taihuense]|uniref:Uncharacterized protein n=1 Tax=Novosphingobium taihuense TaxID=260085 RepID=A0A7W7ADG4_9SPHN|nr:hypothetical protein [Novosphingobium taihuense]TWH87082.1 hypothetical protein IQ25_01359 [Novosphingobium taihuense]
MRTQHWIAYAMPLPVGFPAVNFGASKVGSRQLGKEKFCFWHDQTSMKSFGC